MCLDVMHTYYRDYSPYDIPKRPQEIISIKQEITFVHPIKFQDQGKQKYSQ